MIQFKKATVKGNALIFTDERGIDQSELTGECLLIQVWGIGECDGCEFLNKRNCGGKEIRKRLLSQGGKHIK